MFYAGVGWCRFLLLGFSAWLACGLIGGLGLGLELSWGELGLGLGELAYGMGDGWAWCTAYVLYVAREVQSMDYGLRSI